MPPKHNALCVADLHGLPQDWESFAWVFQMALGFAMGSVSEIAWQFWRLSKVDFKAAKAKAKTNNAAVERQA